MANQTVTLVRLVMPHISTPSQKVFKMRHLKDTILAHYCPV